MGVYIKNVTAKEMNDLFDEHAIWWIEPDDIIDIEEEPQTDFMRGFLQGLHDAVAEIVDEPQPNADQHVQRVEYVGNDGR